MKASLYTKKRKKASSEHHTWLTASSSLNSYNSIYKKHSHNSIDEDFNTINIHYPNIEIIPRLDLLADLSENNGFNSSFIDRQLHGRRSIWHESKFLGLLDNSFSALIKEIDESKYILSQKIDSEEESGPLYSLDVWIKSIRFIIKYANYISSNSKQYILTPKIYHGPNGSIDFYWDYHFFNMLLNVPIEGKGTFSADDNGFNKLNGVFNPDEPNFKFFPSIS